MNRDDGHFKQMDFFGVDNPYLNDEPEREPPAASYADKIKQLKANKKESRQEMERKGSYLND